MRTALCMLALFLAAATGMAQSLSALLEQAGSKATSGDKQQAIEIYRRALAVEPNNVTALSECSNLLEATGHWREAVPLLTRLVALRPNDANSLYRLGRMKSWMDGDLPEASTLLKRAVENDPGNPDYSVAYAEVLSRNGQNEEAISILRPVVAAHADQANARRLLAQLLGREHKTGEALQILQPLLQRPKPELADYEAQAEIEEIAGNMRGATTAYRGILSLDPNNAGAMAKLAEVLSWSQSTRQESTDLFERGLKLDPDNVPLAVRYGELLSWNPATRPRARQLFDRVLARDPGNVRALNGEAQLLAWSGHSQEAMALYEQVLAKDRSNADALRGEAEILNWRGRYAQSHDLLTRAHEIAPDDPRTRVEMARSDVGLNRYAEARKDLSLAQGVQDAEDVLEDVNRGLGTYVQVGYVGRRNRQQLDFNRMDALISMPVNTNRLTFDYAPTVYNTIQDSFNSNHFGVAFDSTPSERLTTRLQFSTNQYPGEPTEWNTALGMHYQLRDSLTLDSGFERAPVEESLISTRGQEIGSIFTGQVQSNIADLGLSYSNSAHHYDASLSFAGGAYTGNNLDTNSRWGMDFNLGKSIRGNAPYLRIAYGVSYLSFDHDADFLAGQASPRISGGYYSPTRFMVNYGGVNASHKFGRKLEWDAAGTAGVQNAQTTFTQFSSAQFASTFATHAIWHIAAYDDLRAGYDYLNVFNAFHRHLVLVAWRHYF